ncbi:MAG: NTP transferase domain-containing protein [Mycobacteriales bacterium]
MAGLVLAAGGGSRMGRPKALLRLRGELLVQRACRLLADGGCAPVLAVVGAGAEQLPALPGVTTVDNPDWATGMGSSLRAGLAAVPSAAPGAGAVVVTLVDTPLLGPEAVRRLVAAGRAGADAAVATYGGEPGHPVLLARSVLADVAAAATGDRGARPWLAAHPDRVRLVPCDGTGDPRDLDVPEDLAGVPAEGE